MRSWVICVGIIGGMLPFARPAAGYAIYNQTSKTIEAKVLRPNKPIDRVGPDWDTHEKDWGGSIAPDDWKACPASKCTGGSLTVKFDWFTCTVPVTKDGYVHIMEHERDSLYTQAGLPLFDSTYPRSYYCESRSADHTLLASLPPGVRGPNGHGDDLYHRDVQFMATGDPQFNALSGKGDDRDLTAGMLQAMKNRLVPMRGIIIAGDLSSTTTTREWEYYVTAASSKFPFIYDGIGNHDYARNGDTKSALSLRVAQRDLLCGTTVLQDAFQPGPVGNAGCRSPKAFLRGISQRHRSTRFTSAGGTFTDDGYDAADPYSVTGFHYSWDWHDVHFVQLNLFVGDSASDANGGYDPYKSLTFLKNDLKTYVGSSGRPVILVHHFPPGTEGTTWNVNYWNAIKQYNVIAIIVGHEHLMHTDNMWASEWVPEANTVEARPDGRTRLPYFIAGSALDDDTYWKPAVDGIIAFIEFYLSDDKLVAKRYAYRLKNEAVWEVKSKELSISKPVPGMVKNARPVATMTVGTGHFGRWQAHAMCPAGSLATEAALRVESDQGGNDDSALNSVRLTCSDPKATTIMSHPGLWGSWQKGQRCLGSGTYLTGARMRIEPDMGGRDDSGANDVQFRCQNGDTNASEGGGTWGDWGSNVECPAGTAVCGLSVRVEANQGDTDDSAMNGLKLHCCPSTFYALVNKDTGRCLDPKGFTGAAGTRVQTYQCDGGLDQAFWPTKGISERGVLANAKSGACLTTPVNGIPELSTCPEIGNKWLVPITDTWTAIKGGEQCLGLEDDRPKLATCRDPYHTQWAAVQLPAAPSQSFLLVNRATGNCMDVYNYDGAPGRGVATYRCDGGADQAFRAETVELGKPTTLKNASQSACLDIEGNQGTAGKPAQLASCNAEKDQTWTIQVSKDPWVKLVNAQKSLCLAANNGNQATLQACSDTAVQQWIRVPLPRF